MIYKPNYHEDHYAFRRSDAWTGATFEQHTKFKPPYLLIIAVAGCLLWLA